MAVLDIRTYPDPVLQRPAEDVAAVDDSIRQLMDDMAQTMYQAAGVGLAAPQVGVSKRVIVVDVTSRLDPSGLITLANPVILGTEGEEFLDEGCLSIPDYLVKVARCRRISVEGLDRHGRRRLIEAEGLLARALQHEIDHVRGILIINHLTGLQGEMARKKLRQLASKVIPSNG